MAGFLATALMLLASYGIGSAIDAYNRNQTTKQGLTQSELIRAVNKGLTEARSKLGPRYNELINKINALPGAPVSGPVRDLIQKAKNQLTKEADRIAKADSAVQAMANSIESQMSGYAYSSDQYKRSKEGKYERNKIIKQSQDLKDMVDRTLGGDNNNA